jgi:polyphosphate kinase
MPAVSISIAKPTWPRNESVAPFGCTARSPVSPTSTPPSSSPTTTGTKRLPESASSGPPRPARTITTNVSKPIRGAYGLACCEHAAMSEPRVLTVKQYEKELLRLQTELVCMQEWIVARGERLVVLFEGRDTAGKDGVIKRVTAYLNPRTCRVVAVPTPTERERTQWFFQRYVAHLPGAGEIVLFDRSWYNRAGVEHVMGYCTHEQYEEFLRFCPQFEQALINDGIRLVKYWLSVSDDEQERRFRKRLSDPRKRWKFSPTDLQARARWVDYAEAKDRMLAYTDTHASPWYVVEGDDKRTARLNLIGHLLSLVPYERLEGRLDVELPPRQERKYLRPAKATERLVPERYKVER